MTADQTQQPADTPAPEPQRDEQLGAPQLSLPKGGGAIRGIGEKFAANPVNGTGSLSVPIYTSPGRNGFGPQFTLSYDSGAANGSFGFGWSLALPAITRKTDKGLPRYVDAQESDVFILSGAEDLVPALVKKQGAWVRDISPPLGSPARTVFGKQYRIYRYRPRVEGGFARIERWVNETDPSEIFWRSISKENVTTWYGKTAESRIADPANPVRIFSWLICESYDDKGNVAIYRYKAEDSAGVDASAANERNRTDTSRSANRYLKRVLYGNRTPYRPDLTAGAPAAQPTDWCFELVFDYGEHDLAKPVPQDTGAPPWNRRLDAFSTYRSTFEVRTHRLCRRALMFHHFDGEPGVGLNCLVRSTDFVHAAPLPPGSTKPFYSTLLSVTQTGYKRNDDGSYLAKALPPLEFEYSEAVIDDTVRDVDARSLDNLPAGLDARHQWVDLDGEGVSGILTEQGGGWFYKPNLSPANQSRQGGVSRTLPKFGPMTEVARRPSLAALSGGRQQLLDLSGDGQLDLVQFVPATPGYFERTQDQAWENFRTFASLPVLDWADPNLRFVDVTGDGHADVLISERDAFRWHSSFGAEGFGDANFAPQARDEEKGPKLVFSDANQSIFLADMSGDGLNDLVRVRDGEVAYWPNLGYGRFGPKVTMDRAPSFEGPDRFDVRRVRLADIDGAGTVDLIYFASDGVQLYFNQSGNAWGPRRSLSTFPPVDSASTAAALDLLGTGTACLVWSSALPGTARRAMRYIDLMGGQKPHLLTRVVNNLGAETRIQYAPSTKFYVADKQAGTPWITRIPFPVHVVERVDLYDYVSRNRFVTRYAYHHGFYDGVEREFRAFGRVDQWDTEEFASLSTDGMFPQATNVDAASHVPPVLTKTWFHTGVFFDRTRVSKHLQDEYYRESGLNDAQLAAMSLDDSTLPTTILSADGSRTPYELTPEEDREACRALRGSILRQEIYASDPTADSARPYSVSERNYAVEALQPRSPNLSGVFFPHARETLDLRYERKLFKVLGDTLVDPHAPPPGAVDRMDPRVAHSITLDVDGYGNALKFAAASYARRYRDPDLTADDQSKQRTTLATYTQSDFTNAVVADDAHRAPLSAQVSSYELLQVQPTGAQPNVTNLFRFAELQAKVQSASDGQHEIAYENLRPGGLAAGQPYRRMIECTRTLYRPDDLGAAAGDAKALLGLAKLESLALPGRVYKLAFTPGLIANVFKRGQAALLPAPGAVFGSTAADGGGYVDLDGDGRFWIPSNRVYYLPAAASPQAEKTAALAHFFLRRRFEDAFGNTTSVDYGAPHDLLAVKLTDAAANVVAVTNDYRVLQPTLLTDTNNNRSAVKYDALGMVAGTAVMGKATENLGDPMNNFAADLTQVQIDGLFGADPRLVAGALLGDATTRIIYDVGRFQASRAAAPTDPTRWEPAFIATIARETHVSDLAPGQQPDLQITFAYSDGYGRGIQKKIQAEPGPVVQGGPIVDPRWVGSGWTIFNNKGKPVRQYEPFFSQLPANGHQFEFGVKAGVSPILCYDPTERIVLTIHPNHTYAKIVFDPWRQAASDASDTVLEADPATDPNVGSFFARLPNADYLPTWFADHSAGTPADQDAAVKASKHANTPTLRYNDALGRVFLTMADDAADGKFWSRVDFDIEDNQRAVGDAAGRTIMTYDYDMLSNRIHQASMDSGERWMLANVARKTIRSWDTRGHNFRTAYDPLFRLTDAFVTGTDANNSDPHTLNSEVLYEHIVYGEGAPQDQALNLRTRIFAHYDTAGVVINQGVNPQTGKPEAFDFKGNLLRSSRQFAQDYKALPDWSQAPPFNLDPDVYLSSTRFDALNRPSAATLQDGSVVKPTYNETGLLERLDVNVRGAAAATAFITKVDYDEKGQRVLIEYGNKTSTAYVYERATFRLSRLTTTRSGFPAGQQVLQDLAFTYDPMANVTHIEDGADIQNVVYFRNKRVEPSADYTYDAIYRLVAVIGREHLGQNGGGQPLPPAPTTYNDVPRVALLHPSDGNAMGTYREQYQYDEVGNFKKVIHAGSDPANPGWSRSFVYNEASLLEPAKVNNRLTQTMVGGSAALVEKYTHDANGNMTLMPQLALMQWDFKDQLNVSARQSVNAADDDGKAHQGERTYYVYDAMGLRARKVTETAGGKKAKERTYLAGSEQYREYDAAGTVTLRRETLHVMDDKRNAVEVDTTTIAANIPPQPAQTVTRYQFDNHLGSACLELDENAAVVTYEEYYPYGGSSYQAGRSVVEASLKRYRFIGKERDEESGLYYCDARYYCPWLGRWTSADPAGIVAEPNLYSYARANPTVLRDPGGRQPDEPTITLVRQIDLDAPIPTIVKKLELVPPGLRPPKNAGSQAGLQYLTNGNPPNGATAAGDVQSEVVGAGGINLVRSQTGQLVSTGASSLTVASRVGLLPGGGKIGAEYGVTTVSSFLLPSPLSLMLTAHVGNENFGVYAQGGQLSDANGRNLGSIFNLNLALGGTAKDNTLAGYANTIVGSASSGQVANQKVNGLLSGTLLLGGSITPKERPDPSKPTDPDVDAGSNVEADRGVSGAESAGEAPGAGPNAYGAELSGTLTSGASAGGTGNLQSFTATALLFYTRQFNNQQGLFGIAIGGSYETGGGGFTGFIRIGIGLNGTTPANTALTTPLRFPP